MNEEIIKKAAEARTPEELLALAKENGIELSGEQAKALFARLHPASGELADDELDAVAGGGCINVSTNSAGAIQQFIASNLVMRRGQEPNQPEKNHLFKL